MLKQHLSLDRTAEDGLVRQLFFQIRKLIEVGTLAVGVRLPSSRKLADDLDVGRNTVISAYEQLTLEGYLISDGRRGTRVSDASRGFSGRSDCEPLLAEKTPHLSQQAQRLGAIERRAQETPPTFQPGLPEVRQFPHDLWGRMLRRAARQVHGRPKLAGYANYSGLPELKARILDHVAVHRGVVADVDQVLVLSSAQAALDLVARMLLDPGDVALHEEPGYAGMFAALQGVSADCVPISVLGEGSYQNLDKQVPESLNPRLIYASPSHQFPTGRVMPLKDRLALLSFADAREAFVLEDDYDSEFHFSGAPISCLQGLDRRGQVIYMGTFSKSLMPALHVAYLIVPKKLVEPMQRALRNIGAVAGIVVQQALADFMSEGHLKAHIRDMSKLYQTRRDALITALGCHCAEYLEAIVPDGGIQLPAYFTQKSLDLGWDDKELVGRLAEAGVESSALSWFFWSKQNTVQPGLFLGYAASSEQEIEQGVERLVRVLKTMPS